LVLGVHTQNFWVTHFETREPNIYPTSILAETQIQHYVFFYRKTAHQKEIIEDRIHILDMVQEK
jgi:hypothetical protein